MNWKAIIKKNISGKKMCDNCGKRPQKFVDEDLPVGPRGFCTEKCWAEYTGMEVKPEGYYGLGDGA
jgi:hypothetical protein